MYECMTSKHPLLIKKKTAVGRIYLLVCVDFPWDKIPLKSICYMKNQYLLFTVFNENQYLSAFLKSKVCDCQDLLSLPLNTQKSNPSHAIAGDRKFYLHDGGVFPLYINLLRFVSSAVGQTNRMTYFLRFAKTCKLLG